MKYILRGSFRVLSPQSLYLFVFLFPVGDCCSPVAENSVGLLGCSFRSWCFQDLPHSDWAGVCDGFAGCSRNAKSPQIHCLVVVTVPASMTLDEDECQFRTAGERNVAISDEDRFARQVSPAGASVDTPSRFVITVDGIRNWSRESGIRTILICVRTLQLHARVAVIGCRTCEIHFNGFRGILDAGCRRAEFRECIQAVRCPARATCRQVGMIQHL